LDCFLLSAREPTWNVNMGGKQTDRKNKKKVVEEEDDTTTTEAGDVKGQMIERMKALVVGSLLLKIAPKLQPLLDPKAAKVAPRAAPAEEKEDESTPDSTETKAEPADAVSLFASIKDRLSWHSPLGMGLPASADDSMAAWLSLGGLELDWGPRKSRRGNPSLDRIVKNVLEFAPQYIHILFVIMLLRTFLGRSFFCCLPWLFGLQTAAVMVPDEMIPEDKVPTKFRVAGATGIHALMLLFFLYELLWATYFMEKILYVGLVALHARSVRQSDA